MQNGKEKIQNGQNGHGHNQTVVRDINLELFFNEFVKGNFSRADIAKKYKISKTASSKIVAELLNLNLITETENCYKRVAPGAIPVLYKLNSDLGLIAVVDMSTPEVVIDVCDFGGNMLAQTKIPNMEKIKRGDIDGFCKQLKQMLDRDNLKGKVLRRICVALPCAIDSVNDKIIWSPRFDLAQDITPEALVCPSLNAKSILVNDVSLLLRGEIRAGLITEDIKYAFLGYIDSGIGGAFYIGGRHESGWHGFAGDIGCYPAVSLGGKFKNLDEVSSINGIKNEIKAQIKRGAKSVLAEDIDNLRFVNIEAAYSAGDPLTKEVVEHSARELGNAIKGIARINNIPFVVISGRITKLGQGYLDIVRERVEDGMLFPVQVDYSRLSDGVNKGAMAAALSEIFDEAVRGRGNGK